MHGNGRGRRFRMGYQGRFVGRHYYGDRLLYPESRPVVARRVPGLAPQSRGGAACDYGFHMAVTWWDRQVFDEMATCVKTYGINTFKHFMPYKGVLMVNDDQLNAPVGRCALLGPSQLYHPQTCG